MRPSRLAALAALSLVFPLSACDTSEPTPPPEQVNLLPLEVGNRWVMAYTLTDSTGLVYESRTDTLGVSRDTVVDGERWFYVGLLSRLVDQGPLRGFFANREDGLYRLVRREDGQRVPVLYYSTVTEPGVAYAIESSYSPGISETATMTLLSTESPSEIPGVGTVPAYHYRRTTTSFVIGTGASIDVEGLTSDVRFSPQYGPVQQQNITVFARERLNWVR